VEEGGAGGQGSEALEKFVGGELSLHLGEDEPAFYFFTFF
jgi:hypothetical protein